MLGSTSTMLGVISSGAQADLSEMLKRIVDA
jgi:hypothetical protein